MFKRTRPGYCATALLIAASHAAADPTAPHLPPAQTPAVAVAGDAETGYTLTRDGEPYFVLGAGGQDHLAQLVAAGGNTIRTWGVGPETMDLLDAAHARGLTVAVGLWLEHERHGFDYGDPEALAEQTAMVREAVLAYRHHPAVLLWGLGNEMEGFGEGDDTRIWDHVQQLAAMVKQLDPARPAMTTITEVGGQRIPMVHERCPDIDIVGINSYGGASSIPQRYREAGGTKPYMITEFGPLGTWEVGKTEWGAVIEPTSTQKAEFYRSSYLGGVESERGGLSLGSFIFLWGEKQEATATWFGMFLPFGERLGSVDTMQELWSGTDPDNAVPTVEPLTPRGPVRLQPGATLKVELQARDPEGDPLQVSWRLKSEASEYRLGGDAEPRVAEYPSAVIEAELDHATLRMPEAPGAYRIFAYVRDGHGGAATANLPLLVLDPQPEE
ncbi:MAG: glycoside hydrolase family 2 TIM barrel-domain containing protein [Planctomycetota bacterium]